MNFAGFFSCAWCGNPSHMHAQHFYFPIFYSVWIMRSMLCHNAFDHSERRYVSSEMRNRNFFFLPICVLPEIAADTVERGAFAEGILVTQTKIHAVQFVLAFQILIFCSCIPDGSHNLAANGSKIHARLECPRFEPFLRSL